MKYRFEKRILSLVLCLSMVFTLIITHANFAFSAEDEEYIPTINTENFENNVGKQAIFDWWSSFDLAPDVESEPGEADTYNYDELEIAERIFVIADYYSDNDGNHWYKLYASDGMEAPEILKENPWVLYSNDEEMNLGFDPYLCIYEAEDTIRFITAEETIYELDEDGNIFLDDNGNPVIDRIDLNYFVIAGPEGLNSVEISITPCESDYPVSVLAYKETTYDTVFSSALTITIDKAAGEDVDLWSDNDGIVSIRYEAAQFGTDTYVEDVAMGAGFLYVDGKLYSAASTDRWGYEQSDVVYTNAGESTLVFEHMPSSCIYVGEEAYFVNDSVTLYDNNMQAAEFLAAQLPVTFTAECSFEDENGEEYYWLENKGFIGSPYFIAKKDDVMPGEPPKEYGDGRVSITDKMGNSVSEIVLPQYEKPEFTAISSLIKTTADVKYQWQICYDVDNYLWVDIYGENNATIKISYGMVKTLLDENGQCAIRCESKTSTMAAYSKPIVITLEMYEPKEPDVVVSESFVTSNGETVTVSVAGDIPEDASVALEETDSSGVEVNEGETVVASLDISIKNADGSEWQPESGETVKVELPATAVGLKNGDRFVVYHLHQGEVKVLGTYMVTNGTVAFDVDGFSKFVFTLAVDTSNVDYAANVEGEAFFNPALYDESLNTYNYVNITDKPENGLNFATDYVFNPQNHMDLRMIIEDYCLNGTGYWYKVKAADGYTLPAELEAKPWIYQNDIPTSNYANNLLIIPPAPKAPDFSGDLDKHAHFTYSANLYIEVSDVEPYAGVESMSYSRDQFSTEFTVMIDDYKVITVSSDIVDKNTGVVIGRSYVQSLWYKVNVVSGTCTDEFRDGFWVLQNYLTEGDEYPVDTLTLFDAPVVPDEPEEPAEPSVGITVNGEAVNEITVSKSDKVTVTATPNVEGSMTYKWQLLIPAVNMWVNISGQTAADCTVNYGMVANRLDSNGQAHIRCVTTIDGVEVISEPIAVNLVTTYSFFNNYWMPMYLSTPQSRAGDGDTTQGDTTLYNVVINYVFENGEVAANPFTSTVGVTGSLTNTVEFPPVQGYLPYVNDVRQDSYTFNLYGNQMTEDFVMNVVYKPTLVDYTIVVMLQNVHNDNYTESEEHRTTRKALTGTVISSDTEVDVNIPGFYQLLHKQATVAADGSTVIEVRFDRYYYLMTFDLGDGGYGVLPVYARYGTEVEVGNPERPGYSFSHWANELGERITFPQSMPERDVTFTAVWNPSDAKYTVVYWKENADDNGYSYWGSVIKESKSGAIVNGSDDIPLTITNATVDGSTVDEKKYFTYNDTLTDKEVVVKGDGSTIVNVYYKRNYYTIYFRGYGKCCLDEHTHGTNCNSKLICTLEVHTHSESCNRTLNCGINEHSAHTAACLECGKTEHTSHTNDCLQCSHASHVLGCYSVGDWYTLKSTDKPTDSSIPNNPVNGTVYTYTTEGWFGSEETHYYLYLDGTWHCAYNNWNNNKSDTTRINDCSHTHDASCYKDELHTHIASCYKDVIHTHNDSCYKYGCGKVVHKHDADDCYSDCTIPAHTHGNNCNSNNTNNTIYVITAKYQQDISALWPTYDKLAASDSKHYKNDNGQPVNGTGSNASRFRGWDVDNASAEAVSKRINMTRDLCDTDQGYQYANATYSASYSYKLYYMFESFDQTTAANGTTRKAYTVNGTRVYFDSDPAYYQELMYNSNTTFNQKQVLGMNPVGREKSESGSGNSLVITNWLYYTRNRSAISYQNIDTVVDTKSDIMFGAPIKGYQYTANNGIPPYPSSLEAGAYQFAGWYTTAGCFDGTEVDFENGTMPNGNVTFYAKWEPVTHTIQFYKQKDDSGNLIEKIGETYEVKHNQKLNEQYIPEAPEDFQNGAYSFNGWWYMDGTTERRYDFKSLPVTENLVVYAKWTSNKQIQYIVKFELSDGTPVADSITSSDLAGTTVTFDAKGANELYPKYREGYFPDVKSHSITLDINDADGVMEFTFVYTPGDPVPYTVYYLAETLKDGGTSFGTHTVEGKTYYIIAETKTVSNNKLAYVSENFVPVVGYVPDDFQKNLVIVPKKDNTIVFYYKVDTKNAPYKVTHYFQNLDGNGWTVEKTYSSIGAINDTYTESPMTGLVGFTYDPTIEGSKASGVITADGLELKLYYVRNKYPYKVIYKDRISGEVLDTTTLPVEMYGKVVSATAPNVFGNRTLVSDATQTLTIRVDDIDNPTNNVITFFYEETNVNLNYVVVGPDGTVDLDGVADFGQVSQNIESVKISTGKAQGSTAITPPSNLYKFVGWYSDAECKNPVPAAWVDASGKITPQKPGDLWANATYYAKFEYNLTSLTIKKDGWETIDPNQTFIFNIKGNGVGNNVNLDVTVHGNGSVTIEGLTVGAQYTITEKTDWSWRYSCTGWEYGEDKGTGYVAEDNGEGNVATITLGLNGTITFTNTRDQKQWLDGDSWCNNMFKPVNQTK